MLPFLLGESLLLDLLRIVLCIEVRMHITMRHKLALTMGEWDIVHVVILCALVEAVVSITVKDDAIQVSKKASVAYMDTRCDTYRR